MKFAYVFLFCLSTFGVYGFGFSSDTTALKGLEFPCNTDSCVLKNAWDLAIQLPRGEVDKSFKYASILSNIGQKNHDTLSVVRSYIIHGNINLVTLSRYDSVKYYAQKGLSVIDTSLGSSELARLYNLFGIGILYEGRELESLDYFKKSQRIYENLEDYCQMATMTHNIAKLYKSFGNEEETARHIKDAIATKTTFDCQDNISYMYLNLCAFYETENQIDSTIKYAKLTLLEDKAHNSESEIGPAFMFLAKAYNKLNVLDSANLYIDKSIRVAKLHENIKLKSYAYLNKSQIIAQENIDSAMLFIHQALQFARPNSALLADIIEHKSSLLKQQGKYKASLELMEEANSIRDSLNGVVEYGEMKSKEAEESAARIHKLEKESILLNSKSNRNQLILLAVIILISLVSLYFFIRFKRWKKMKEEQLVNIERTKEIALSKSQMEMLRSQMNPHFIFNSLNSIKSFFIRNDQQAAIDYLSEFSVLIRKVLENSSKEMIPLSDNIQWIKHYCALENKRLGNSLHYTVNYDLTADFSSILIPPMLIQPFVENAIWHGLSKKTKGERRLEINYIDSESNYIICEIDDNGVGFPKDSLSPKSSHISLGTRITDERLQAIRTFYDEAFTYTILHKKDQGKEGTKVVLKLPKLKKDQFID